MFVLGLQGIFTANFDTNSKVTNKLSSPIVARFFRIYPWAYSGRITMRAELLGCMDDGSNIPTVTPDAGVVQIFSGIIFAYAYQITD